MSRIGKIARRTFLFGSVAVAGGVAFGVYAVRKPHDNPLKAKLAAGAATFNPWVLIDSTKITLITPHADKGQGVVSSQAALIAEELDVEFGQFETSFGQPSPAYWNTAMAEEAVPFRATDNGFAAETMRDVMGGVMKLLGFQGTGGSTTIPDSFEKLRRAGAIARETLKLAASQETGVPVKQLTTANGTVLLPDGTALPYTALAATAATLDPVGDVTLRAPDTWRMIGKPMQRLDIVAKSTGTQTYGVDVDLPGMVHATVCTNPRRSALNSFDASAALKMRGITDVVEVTNGLAVLADNTWRAMQAMQAIEFDWAAAPYPPEQDGHWTALEASFTEEARDNTWVDNGDVETALTGDLIEAEYRSPYVAHAPLEPLNAIVLVEDAHVTVWTGHQFPRQLQVEVAKITGHDADQVVLHNQYIGGSFGHRHLQMAAPSVIASQTGRIGLSVPGPDSQIAAGAWNNPYTLPAFRMRAYRAPELAPTSSWRSVGAPGAGFVFDTFLDEMIHAAGADPMAERIRLMDNQIARAVIETVAEMSDWGAPLAPNQGKGVAFVESFGVPVAEVVQVTATDQGIRIDNVWAALDAGTVVDPINYENLVQGGIIFGLGHAMNCEITYADGRAEQENYHAHEAMRIHQCPVIEVKALENQSKIRGLGEPPVPPAAPALGNAIFAATGQRIREMPLNRHIDFV